VLPPGDIEGLSAALLRLADDDAYRRHLADAARRRGALLPSWDDTARAFFAALREVAGAGPR
jgi:glycosyltransferase involved in cell wall biosynthesis